MKGWLEDFDVVFVDLMGERGGEGEGEGGLERVGVLGVLGEVGRRLRER